MRTKFIVSAVVAAAGLVTMTAAPAFADESDDIFIATLESEGVPFSSSEDAIALAEAVWPVALGDGWLAAVLAAGGGGVELRHPGSLVRPAGDLRRRGRYAQSGVARDSAGLEHAQRLLADPDGRRADRDAALQGRHDPDAGNDGDVRGDLCVCGGVNITKPPAPWRHMRFRKAMKPCMMVIGSSLQIHHSLERVSYFGNAAGQGQNISRSS